MKHAAPRFHDRAGEVHAGDVRVSMHQPAETLEDHAVLVVEARILDGDVYVAIRQLGLGQLLDVGLYAAGVFVQHERPEHAYAFVTWFSRSSQISMPCALSS
jgi:hypothetical protein